MLQIEGCTATSDKALSNILEHSRAPTHTWFPDGILQIVNESYFVRARTSFLNFSFPFFHDQTTLGEQEWFILATVG